MKDKRIVLIGADGFMGSSIARNLKVSGFNVVQITRQNSGDVRKANSNWFMNGDIVIHAAGVVPRKVAPEVMIARNVAAGQAICRAFTRAGCDQLILVSSASVYGTKRGGPRSEQGSLEPENQYGRACLEVENVVRDSLDEGGFSIMRPFNVYGPKGHGLVDRLLRAGASGISITLDGQTPIRDYISVQQVAESVPLLLGKSVTVNLGTGHGRSNKQVAEMVAERYPGLKEHLRWGNPPSGIDVSVADPTRAHSLGLPVQDSLPQYILDATS